MATRFSLRSLTCPGCGARVPHEAGQATVVCEYCGTSMEVVRGGGAKPAAAASQSYGAGRPAQVAPQVRPGVFVVLGILPLVISGAVTAVATMRGSSAAAPTPPATAAPVGPMSTPPPPAVAVAEEPAAAPVPDPADAPAGPAAPEPGTTATKAPRKKKRKRKPKPYDIARLIKPALAGCAPRDLTAPGHPVWYTPTITLTVKDGALQDVSVTVKPSDTDLAKIHWRGDYKKPVTQEDLDTRVSRVARCVKKNVSATKIPPDHAQARAEGKMRVTFSWDGVPYGVKNL